ncbi:uncharacterized protein LOC110466571 isoform X4 [Mizuhopecten yessoensis]|uniref:uncharacterized protein LOC110466571 isoform X4 n=1 Tax=Mizuhopecten yessoensis TaxID=6573 RepID=UPI000B4573D9|nr:uncharacterized protein LOC110466571 isoform X4 [Mizuhopecten yessoensis]
MCRNSNPRIRLFVMEGMLCVVIPTPGFGCLSSQPCLHVAFVMFVDTCCNIQYLYKYDPITICGWHGNTSSLADALPEMIRVVKPGGYICVVIRMDFVKDGDDYKDTYLRQCVKLAADDKWEQKQFTRFPSLITDVEGVKMMFKVC